MKVIGYITLFWLNVLGFFITYKYSFYSLGRDGIPGIALLNFYGAISFSVLLVCLLLTALLVEPNLRKWWVYLLIVGPTLSSFIASVRWRQPEVF